ADLPEDPPRLGGGEGPRLQALGQIRPLEVLHDEERPRVGQRAEREDVDDVRVADLVDRARLLDEPANQVGDVRALLRQHLDGDPLADDGMVPRIDGAHPPFGELAIDDVLAELGSRLEVATSRLAHVPATLTRQGQVTWYDVDVEPFTHT